MPSVGPQIPPHIQAKRGITDVADSETRKSESSSPEGASKRRRVVGPTAPPAPLNERPARPADGESDSSSDDGYGPALPSAKASSRGGGGDSGASACDKPAPPSESAPKRATRDEWMTLPPKQDDLAARLDPTKIRARKFNTGKGAKGPSAAGGVENTLWTETPEEKRKRLADEVMGITPAAGARTETARDRRAQQDDEEKARKIREHNERHRAQSLYEQHQGSTKKEKEDDPSKRAFDYEKDMGGGMKIGHAQRKEMLNKAADFGSRFSKGSYL